MSSPVPDGFALELSLFLLVAVLGYLFAKRLGQSAVVGEIFLGVLMGPSLLNLIHVTDFVSTLATLGAIFLLFSIGLETSAKDVFKARYALIAAGGVIVPWLAGFFVATAFGYPVGPAMFIGAALTATSIAITAQVLREAKMLDSKVAQAIIGAAVVDDVLALLAISISASFATDGVQIGLIAQSVVGAALFLSAGLLAGNKLIVPQIARLQKWGEKHGQPETTFLAAIAVALAYAFVAELMGLSAIVGSFLAGVSLNNLHESKLHESARSIEVLFSAIFFVSIGVLVDIPAALTSLPFVLVLTLAAIASKYVGARYTARGVGLTHNESVIVGWGMVPRGEIAFVAALIGLNSGLIDKSLYAAVLLMSLLTTIAAPALIQRALSAEV